MKTYHTFKTPALFEKWLQTKHDICHPKMSSECLDYVTVGGILYTMHEFDMDGCTITWANKKHKKMIELTTSDRYKYGYQDSKIEAYPASYLRNDIVYAQ